MSSSHRNLEPLGRWHATIYCIPGTCSKYTIINVYIRIINLLIMDIIIVNQINKKVKIRVQNTTLANYIHHIY